jgi:hypothetical protein
MKNNMGKNKMEKRRRRKSWREKKKKNNVKKKKKRKNKKIYEKSYFLHACFRVLVNIDVINY